MPKIMGAAFGEKIRKREDGHTEVFVHVVGNAAAVTRALPRIKAKWNVPTFGHPVTILSDVRTPGVSGPPGLRTPSTREVQFVIDLGKID